MGLPALEFSDCCLDSPHFRETLKSHEAELDKTNKFIKELIKDGKSLISALKNLSSAKRKFADSLNEFKFQCIGDAETDDEMCIARSLQEFATVLRNLEDERIRMIENASEVLITPLEKFRKEQIGAAKEAKKKYDKETEKYCGILEKHLNLSSKKKESQLQEADSQVDLVRQHFYEVSLEYVFKVQEVQERKMFEFVEPLLAFLQGLFTFYHHGYELAKDFGDFKTQLTISIQNTRNRFEGTRSEVESLMKKMKENPLEHKTISPYTMEGYLYVQEKRHFGTSWVKHYCTYQRDSKQITMVPFDQKSGGKGGEDESVILKSCTRRKTDSIEKRFCFDVEAVDRPGVITMQALSEEDRRLWMEAMDGREPVYNSNKDSQSEGTAQLDSIGFSIIRKCIHAVETRGINEQGLYRIVGVNSRVQKLLSVLMDPKTASETETDICAEWEIKTITSALKTYLRMLPGPLMMYQFQRSFIKAAKLENQESRVSEIHSLVHRLPEKNRQMLQLLMNHLANVANNHKQNLMTVANLGVVFGPTLLRPQEETVAAIMDIKFQNIVIEILIENHEKIFNTVPDMPLTNAQLHLSRKKSSDSKPPSCSERPLTLFHTVQSTEKQEQRNSIINSSLESVSSNPNSILNSSSSLQPNMNSSDPDLAVVKPTRPNSLPPNPSPTSPLSPSWPMFSAPSSPMPTSSTSSDSSPVRSVAGFVWFSVAAVVLSLARSSLHAVFSLLVNFVPCHPNLHLLFDRPEEAVHEDSSTPFRKAKALYACKAEHDSELSFTAGTVFDNVHPSQEPGWLEGTLNGKTGLIPENYVEFL
ncbi:Rho GTPase activating protein 26 [Homo sapiens]|uniref:Rho GTPase-activating protein 26 n=4 Tax=Homo sapiens TaxID=9606 RepID=RHG26_HUMAN|nr:rho GTPase-activating protein 26 isoform a [Homo sapiens]Q9UNA1.1 RecName: Full=Rho GTPase-activating protein 26; AltName: Full=GTPase regulator associated with focal adhesion kinase; Short=GRAF1; AltName: Full=Oligophrenin-1-like protein; AltName: Full=Rho-type GTPase-activating protein 26 [Homo sapiens]AAD39482.1 oligophrenin-1 like protein [Homo sapiens]EAW61877.1 Rho GTPase activating protein 26, isoform CRA_b [Homo sapiens]KAI2539482.1 Rho GTPase activating protein 26 [Homo sapiens]KAI|eukprot:NP_055886.1 rho GTPase-activating protein 26 isoform a [Homo sapiens]